MKIIKYVPHDYYQSFKDVIRAYNPDEDQKFLLNYNGTNKEMLFAKYSLKIAMITSVLNCGWEADWSDDDQCKYYPWFRYNKNLQLVDNQGLNKAGFSYIDYSYQLTYSSIAGRLCFKTEDLAVFAGKTFELEYNDYLSC